MLIEHGSISGESPACMCMMKIWNGDLIISISIPEPPPPTLATKTNAIPTLSDEDYEFFQGFAPTPETGPTGKWYGMWMGKWYGMWMECSTKFNSISSGNLCSTAVHT